MTRERQLRIALAVAIGVILVLVIILARIDGAWEREAIERGYGEWCWPDRHFAWQGECR